MSGLQKENQDEEIKRVKTFMISMDWFNLTVTQKEMYLKDKRLSLVEKTVLECSLLLRENKYFEIISKLEDLKPNNQLVESQRCFVLGVCLNSCGKGHESISLFQKAREILREHNLKQYEFNVLNQLFYVHLNLKTSSSLPEILDRMQELIESNEKDHISYLRCRFNYHVFLGNNNLAKEHLRALEKIKEKMHPGQFVSHLVDKFIYFLKIDQLKKCEETLAELKEHRRYRMTENFVFMQALLSHYMHRKPIYLYDDQFKNFPLLFFQLKVIQMLESGNKIEARKHWNELKNINPEVYSDFMEYKGDKCLFSLCLNLYQQEKSFDLTEYSKVNLQPREKLLLEILSKSGTPVMKETLYMKIWGGALQSKEDLTKLAMMISRIKRKTGIEIKSIKGSYKIEIKNSKKRKAS
jgi:tetratricopeptide (TPR) repeat protein